MIREASPRAEVAYQVVSAFMHMLRERTGEYLENWLDTVEQSQLVELAPFVTGIQRDQAAVLAGLSLPWSNGPLEGQVNRLKLIKRIVSWGFSFSVAETGLKRLQNNVH